MVPPEGPGNPIEEVPSGGDPIDGIDTAVAGFVAVVPAGSVGTVSLASYAEFRAAMHLASARYLDRAVHGWFENGGGPCHVIGVDAWDPYLLVGSDGTALSGLPRVTILCAPGLMGAFEDGLVSSSDLTAVQRSLIGHCEERADRLVILDAPAGLSGEQVLSWRQETAYDSSFAALYWPWVQVFDPVTGRISPMPPSGHLAGVWARSDDTHGVQKSPADEVIRGVVDLAYPVTRAAQEALNPAGVNVLCAFEGRQGILVWGARTLAVAPAYRYLSARRLMTYLQQSIVAGTSWVVFEPNGAELWARIRTAVSHFLLTQWQTGALKGNVPEDAFYVRCDEQTNLEATVAAGGVVSVIGVATSRPAEFEAFRITWSAGGVQIDQ